MTTLSVILTNYNHGHYIGGALEAILNQSYRPSEVIVVDDASTDDSIDVIRKYAGRDPIVHLYRNEQNRGALYSANRAFSLATGEYLYSAASDDYVLPGLFEKSIRLLEQHPQAGLCCTDPSILDHETGIVTVDHNRWSKEPRYLSPDELADVLRGWYIAGHTAIVKRSAIVEMGGYLGDLKWYCDWFASLAIGFRYGICYLPESLAVIRRIATSYSAAGKVDPAQQREALTALLSLLKSPAYRDLLPYFMRSAALAHFGPEVVNALMATPQHWDAETLLLLQVPLQQWASDMTAARKTFQETLNAPNQTTLWKMTPWIKTLCARDGVDRVYFYGAGRHTEVWLRIWRAQGAPPVEGIVVSEKNGIRDVSGVPVISAADFTPKRGDGIVLSSALFETQMAAFCKAHWPQTPCYPLYSN